MKEKATIPNFIPKEYLKDSYSLRKKDFIPFIGMLTYTNRVLGIPKENTDEKLFKRISCNIGFLTAYSILASFSLMVGISKLEKLLSS